MTLPITGPFTQNYGINSPVAGSYRVQKTGYKQGRPYDRPLSYSFSRMDTLSVATYNGGTVPAFANSYSRAAPTYHNPFSLLVLQGEANVYRLEVLEKARSRALDSLGDPAALLTLIAEYQSNLAFIANAAMYVRDFVKVRRGILKPPRKTKGGRSLRKPRESITKHLPTKKDIASDYLAIQFVVLPTIADIERAMSALERTIPVFHGKGTATRRFDTTFDDKLSSSTSWQRSEHKSKISCKVEAELRVTNPNLFLANRLGLINPVLTAYEVTPWSFVFDYFVNVSAWLGQFTETAGVTLHNAYHTVLLQDSVTYKRYTRPNTWTQDYVLKSQVQTAGTTMQRTLGLPAVTLRVRAPWRLSTTRASTSVALLLQMLRS